MYPGWPEAAKAVIEHEFDTDHLNVWVTFEKAMDIDVTPPLANWNCIIDTVDNEIASSVWQDEYTLLLTVDDVDAAPDRVLLEYTDPDDGLKTTYGKQWEPWGPILSIFYQVGALFIRLLTTTFLRINQANDTYGMSIYGYDDLSSYHFDGRISQYNIAKFDFSGDGMAFEVSKAGAYLDFRSMDHLRLQLKTSGHSFQFCNSSWTVVASIDYGGIIQPSGYKSSDGSAGITATKTVAVGDVITIKNGLITAYSP
jgi:hypothetical protein